jgi:hypothetical protein
MQTRDGSLQLPSLEVGHAVLRTFGKGDIGVDSFSGKHVNGKKGDLTAASEIGDITVVKMDANDVNWKITREGNILTSRPNVNTAHLYTALGDILTEGFLSQSSLYGATDEGDIIGEYGFPREGASLWTKQGCINAGIVGYSRAGGKFQVTNDQGDVYVKLVPSEDATGALEHFQGTLEVTCPGEIDLNGKTRSNYVKKVFGDGSVIWQCLFGRLTFQ